MKKTFLFFCLAVCCLLTGCHSSSVHACASPLLTLWKPDSAHLEKVSSDWRDYQRQRELDELQRLERQAMQGVYEQRQQEPLLLLVNGKHPLPDDYETNLVSVSGGQMDARAAQAFERMLSAGRSAGMRFRVISTYRTYAYQKGLFQRQLSRRHAQGYSGKQAVAAASRVVAYPGTSEHHTGLAVDIVSAGYDTSLLTRDYENTEEAQWLKKHCAEYGFILRYPDGKSDLTGVIYEPWHYRYVGTEYAEDIMSSGLCLEEYLGMDET